MGSALLMSKLATSQDAAQEKQDEDVSTLNEDKLYLKNAQNLNSKYQVSEHSYPEGVASDADKLHYMQFYINVRGNSKFNEGSNKRSSFKQAVMEDKTLGAGQNRFSPQNAEKQREVGFGLAGAQGAASMATAVGAIKGKSIIQTGAAAVGTFIAGAAVGKIAAEKTEELGVLQSDVPKRLLDVITLHIQDRPAVNYSVQYQEDEIGTFGGFLAGGMGTAETQQGFGETAKEAATATGAAIIGGLSKVLSSSAGRMLETGTKQKLNPFREQFFERVDFRTFNFRHTFMPKSQEEARKVRNIIKLFKFHMHPEMASGKGLFFLYPSEFEIKYYYKERENPYFNRISTCVLEDMNVEYGGDIFSTFETGQPVEVNMTLRFKELEVMTKERIAEGY